MSNLKRGLESGDEGKSKPSKRAARSTVEPPLPKSASAIQAYPLPEDMSVIAPADVLNLLPGGARYIQDLFAVATHIFGDEDLASMHKDWARVRKPNFEEIFKSRYPIASEHAPISYAKSDKKTVKRNIVTLKAMEEALGENASTELIRYLAMTTLDYEMTLAITCRDMEGLQEASSQIPWFRERFEQIVNIHGRKPSAESDTAIAQAQTESAIPADTKLRLAATRVDPQSVKSLDDVVGQAEAKMALRMSIVAASRFKHWMAAFKEEVRGGILLHGPPGTGKTMLALAAASDRRCTVFRIEAVDLLSKWVGATETNITALFEEASRNSPAVIILDEVDHLFGVRRSSDAAVIRNLKAAFLTAMTRYTGVTVIGATNLPWDLDQAFRRRFEIKIRVGLPNKSERRAYIQQRLGARWHNLSDEAIEDISEKCDGFTIHGLKASFTTIYMEDALHVSESKYFLKRQGKAEDYYYPCPSNCPNAIETTFEALGEDCVWPACLTKETLLRHTCAQQNSVLSNRAAEEKHKAVPFYDYDYIRR